MENSFRTNPGADNIRVSRLLTQIVVSFLFLGAALFAIKTSQYWLGLALVFVPLATSFISKPVNLFILILCIRAAGLQIPMVAGGTSATPVLELLMIVIMLLQTIFRRTKPVMRTGRRALIAFTCTVAVTAGVRGVGFAFLGSNVIGGMTYITMLSPVFVFLVLKDMTLSSRDIKSLVVAVAICGAIPFLVQFFVAYAGAAFFWLTKFFRFSVERIYGAATGADEFGQTRYETLVGFAFALLPLALVLMPKGGLLKLMQRVLLVVCMVALLQSGFRRYMIGFAFIVSFYYILTSKSRARTITMLSGVAFGAVILAYIVAPMLPYTLQRAVAFLPGINIDYRVLRDTTHSMDFRYDLWAICVKEMPQYLMIGRGLLLTLAEALYSLQTITQGWDVAYYYYFIHGYHNGVLEVLLDLGLAGFASLGAFHFCIIKKEMLKCHFVKNESLAARYHTYLCIYGFWRIVAFWAGGGIKTSLPDFIYIAMQLILIRIYLERQAAQPQAETVCEEGGA